MSGPVYSGIIALGGLLAVSLLVIWGMSRQLAEVSKQLVELARLAHMREISEKGEERERVVALHEIARVAQPRPPEPRAEEALTKPKAEEAPGLHVSHTL